MLVECFSGVEALGYINLQRNKIKVLESYVTASLVSIESIGFSGLNNQEIERIEPFAFMGLVLITEMPLF
jgi:hypothetical protein